MSRLPGLLSLCGLLLALTRPVSAQIITQTPLPVGNATPLTATPVPSLTPTPRPVRVTATLTPTPGAAADGFVREASAAVAYPEGVVFQAVFDLPAREIAEVRLSIRYGVSAPVVTPVMTFRAFEGGTRYEYVWSIPLDSPPDLFSILVYTWEAEAVDGRTARYQQQLRFEDTRTRWQIAGEPNDRSDASGLEIALPESPLSAARVQTALAAPYRLLAQNTGIATLGRLIFYPPGLDPGCERDGDSASVAFAVNRTLPIPCREGAGAALLDAGGWMALIMPDGADESALVERVVSQSYQRLWRERAAAVPAWFLSGLVQHYQTGAHTPLLPLSQASVRAGTALSMVQMNLPPNDANAALWQAQSYGFVAYTADIVGYTGVYALANALADEPFEAAYARIVGQDAEAIAIEWANWIFTREAERAYALTPYDAATPTPLPTETPSLPRTPTAVPTATRSLTPTRIVNPTITASHTPLPPPPTTTPRRPGSLATPVPASAQTAAFSVPPLIVGGLIVVLLLLIALLVYVTGRERRL